MYLPLQMINSTWFNKRLMMTMMTKWKTKQRNTIHCESSCSLFVDAHFLSLNVIWFWNWRERKRTYPPLIGAAATSKTQYAKTVWFCFVADFESTKTIEQARKSDKNREKKTRKTHLIIMNALIPVYRLGMSEASGSRLQRSKQSLKL